MAGADFKLENVKQFMGNFNMEVQKMRGRTIQGLIKAGIVLWRAAEPHTPVDTSNLNHSWFIVSMKGTNKESKNNSFTGEKAGQRQQEYEAVTAQAEQEVGSFSTKKRPFIIFGYTANYAVFVHENVDANFKRHGARARWLYKAMRDKEEKMLEIIAEESKFK